MLTDKAPFDYLYTSRRLLRDLVQHDQAARPRVQREFTFGFRGLSYRSQRRSPDLENLHDLAMRSHELVSDHCGDLDDQWSTYVYAEAPLSRGVFAPLMGWRGGEVACFKGEAETGSGLQAFIALFGSASNMVGYRAHSGDLGGFTPSDMAGLYAVLDAVREREDPEIGLQHRLDDFSLDRRHVIEESVDFARSGARHDCGKVAFLTRRLIPAPDGYRDSSGQYDRVLIGTPLWVATILPTESLDGLPARNDR
jgi:hypothetical protein